MRRAILVALLAAGTLLVACDQLDQLIVATKGDISSPDVEAFPCFRLLATCS
jgi:hypothetical protein